MTPSRGSLWYTHANFFSYFLLRHLTTKFFFQIFDLNKSEIKMNLFIQQFSPFTEFLRFLKHRMTMGWQIMRFIHSMLKRGKEKKNKKLRLGIKIQIQAWMKLQEYLSQIIALLKFKSDEIIISFALDFIPAVEYAWRKEVPACKFNGKLTKISPLEKRINFLIVQRDVHC